MDARNLLYTCTESVAEPGDIAVIDMFVSFFCGQ